jgi:hypothetical protein
MKYNCSKSYHVWKSQSSGRDRLGTLTFKEGLAYLPSMLIRYSRIEVLCMEQPDSRHMQLMILARKVSLEL